MNYATGSLVKARGRDWVVLPPEEKNWLLLKPLGGTDDEIISISPALEEIGSASFALPDPTRSGDATTCSLLRDAVRLGFRATTGPFRSFGHIAVDPRPYQLVPLLLAMKQSVVRLLIADDVGIGKTVEALLIARELLDRGEIRRMSIICPPQLAEQWQHELAEKFHIQAELVLSSTVSRLERGIGAGTSIFEAYPITIVSLDYIKSDRHRLEFIRACPELVIIDEAHSCASAQGNRSGKQRYELVRLLAEDPSRHMIFVTATPHSGKEDVFRSLLCFLNPEFVSLPEDLSGKAHEADRRRLAEYFVQRRRGDIRAYMDAETPFPVRKTLELTWTANTDWTALFDGALNLARESIQNEDGSDWSKRIRWWSALALLRSVSSSPAAAAATLRSRALGMDQPENMDQLDAMGRQAIFDLDSTDDSAIMDTLPGSDDTDESRDDATVQRGKFTRLARMAEALMGEKDSKVKQCIAHIKDLLKDGYSPVIFCRFIPTAEYVKEQLRKALPKYQIEAVTGLLPPAEREARVAELAVAEKRVLVCTDCLSEGINLQEAFNAVVHYDLSWNPTRHEQREGRVDRFGQPFPEVRIITWYSPDNPMDGMVLDVLLRKHESIRKSLGISVPVPADSDKVMQTLLQGLLLRKKKSSREQNRQLLLPGMDEVIAPEKKRISEEWDNVAMKEEKRSKTFFAHQSVKTEEVSQALRDATEAAGGSKSVEEFVLSALPLLGAVHHTRQDSGRNIHGFSIDEQARLRHTGLDFPPQLDAVFSFPCAEGQTVLTRTHPLVEQLASYLTETALDPLEQPLVSRCGVMRTGSVEGRTTLLLCRFRFQITTTGEIEHTCLAEECALLSFTGSPQKQQWQSDEFSKSLLAAAPDQNVGQEQAEKWLGQVIEGMPELMPHIHERMSRRADALLETHRQVRDAAKRRNLRYVVQAQGEPDILGIFVYLPSM